MHSFDAELWEWEGDAAWHFLTLPDDVSDDVRARAGAPRGFGSVRVRVTVGSSTWSTSVFPDRKRGAYLLPVKKAVRVSEGLAPGDVVAVSLTLVRGLPDVRDGSGDPDRYCAWSRGPD